MKSYHSIAGCLLCILWANTLVAEVKMPAIFSDHMVLQTGMEVPVWGFAAPSEKVTVTVADQTKSTQADAKGNWSIKLAELKSGTVTSMVIEGTNKVEIQDVLVGEVWLGSGQSNMAMPVKGVKDFENEIANAKFPQIRMFREISTGAATVQAEAHGKWLVCTPENVGTFSATLYFFGRELNREMKVPIGLINSSVGGTPIECWIAADTQRAEPVLKPYLTQVDQPAVAALEPPPAAADPSKVPAGAARKAAQQAARQASQRAAAQAAKKDRTPGGSTARASTTEEKILPYFGLGGLFNAKIAPLIPYAIRGMVWYQGEANSASSSAGLYQYQLPLLVKDWRSRWGYEFPVAWVQLPNYIAKGRDWPTVREAMLKTLSVPNTGMVISIDVGEKNDIHPKNKQEIGRRLSLWALGKVYGKKVPATSGPLSIGHEVRGNEIAVKFSNTDGGLKQDGQNLLGFMIAGTNRVWKPAIGRIEGDEVIVSNEEVPLPIAVRYAWDNYPLCNLYNGAGLPASPFRTDDWKH